MKDTITLEDLGIKSPIEVPLGVGIHNKCYVKDCWKLGKWKVGSDNFCSEHIKIYGSEDEQHNSRVGE